ncbi:OmpA family protein [Methylocaldum szegediense]|uniref:OmpA-OmpF porin, OOP family n=1 Tax=Methylocaldum szegediense TaxID=73780 RepID=A0ABN8X9J2_9GAMM|nr:OmpA family protein [Methylocaldum szegediense]CAI8958796.1 OmpA-OmpF porin, OOP family [Methylocaldum szegediense]
MTNKTIIVGAIAALLAGCASGPYGGSPQFGKTATGAVIGAATGAGLGAVIAKDKGKGALIGAGVGGLLGAGVGAYMDRQETQLRDQLAGTGIEVQRSGNDLVLNMPSNVTFAYNSDQISPQAASALTQVATTLNQFPETLLTVVGHTDSDGSDAYNMDLSRRRANAVSEFLMAQGVSGSRLQTIGMGKSQPIASNSTEEGKARNRRVELLIRPNQAAVQQQPVPQQDQGYYPPAGTSPQQPNGYPQQPAGYPQQTYPTRTYPY